MKTNRLFSFLIRLNSLLYILLFVVVDYISLQITHLFPSGAGKNDVANMLNTPFKEVFFGIIIGPYIETLLFQTLVIFLICKIVKRPKYNFCLSILLSAILFSISHTYSLYYVLYAFIGGVIYANAYYFARYKKWSATLTVFIIHAIHNTITTYIN